MYDDIREELASKLDKKSTDELELELMLGKGSREEVEQVIVFINRAVARRRRILEMKDRIEKLNVDDNKVFSNIHKYGNTTAASVGIALTEAIQQNKIQDNDIVVLAAFGSGFYWSSVVIRW